MTKHTSQKASTPKTASSEVDKVLSSLATPLWAKNINAQSYVHLLSPNELTSISALIAYVALNSGETEFGIERRVADRFNVANVTRLPSSDYETAVRFLIDSCSKISKM